MLSCRWMEEKVQRFLLRTLPGRAAFQVTHTAEECLSDLGEGKVIQRCFPPPPCQPGPFPCVLWPVIAFFLPQPRRSERSSEL